MIQCESKTPGYAEDPYKLTFNHKKFTRNGLYLQKSKRKWTTDYRLPTTDYRLPTTNYQLPTTNYQLPYDIGKP